VYYFTIIRVDMRLLVWMRLLKMYALLASISRRQLITSWVGNRLVPYVNISKSPSSNPSPRLIFLLFPIG